MYAYTYVYAYFILHNAKLVNRNILNASTYILCIYSTILQELVSLEVFLGNSQSLEIRVNVHCMLIKGIASIYLLEFVLGNSDVRMIINIK